MVKRVFTFILSCVLLLLPMAASASASTSLPDGIAVHRHHHRHLAHHSQPARSEPYGVWDRLAACESGGRWAYNGPSGFDGGVQFLPATWSSMTRGMRYPAYAWQATREQQIRVAKMTLARSTWAQQWPNCSRTIGVR